MLVEKAKAKRSRPIYTKKLDASFVPNGYADSHFVYGDDDDEAEEAVSIEELGEEGLGDYTLNETAQTRATNDNHAHSHSKYHGGPVNTNIVLPRVVPQPQHDKVMSMSNLLKTKVISPYLTRNRPSQSEFLKSATFRL